MQHPQTLVISSSFVAGKSLQKEVTYVIDRKNAGDLPTFSGRIIDYEKWVEKVIEHLCSHLLTMEERARHCAESACTA